MTTILIPDFRIVSCANAREHWREKAKRVKAYRETAYVEVLIAFAHSNAPPLPLNITLIRIAPRFLDSDNLAASLKPVRDGVADALLPANRGNQKQRWADDSDEQTHWSYGQQKGRPKQYAVEITIETRGNE